MPHFKLLITHAHFLVPDTAASPTLLPCRQPLQTRQISVEEIRVTSIRVCIRVLPDGLVRPPTRDRAWRRGVAREHERAGGVKDGGVARARGPPVVGAIDHRVAGRFTVVGVDEVLDPGHHGGGAQTVARRARRVVLDVEHAGQGAAVARPAAAVREEEVRLSGAGARVGMRKVVAAADQTSGGGARVVT